MDLLLVPNRKKQSILQQRFKDRDIKLEVPDLNQQNFTYLTLTRQIEQVAALFNNFNTP